MISLFSYLPLNHNSQKGSDLGLLSTSHSAESLKLPGIQIENYSQQVAEINVVRCDIKQKLNLVCNFESVYLCIWEETNPHIHQCSDGMKCE